ncbi:cytochrome b [Falsiroseomonas oryzae]|uniref:cytochrome b n=1 Tax=Falsiroseomonas oryzae TaxID=2766473 RepID=UPI0022EACABE|nr:cytochrome b [Roseomonas sp. MO-31]
MRRYPIPSILLHWTMAAAIAGAWLIGQLMEEIPRGGGRTTALGAHALVGLAVVALLLPRILARLAGGAPDPAGPIWEQRLAAAAHLLLYALMLAVPLSGLAIAMSGRAPVPVLGLFEIPPALAGFGMRKPLEGMHEVLANLMLGAVALHVAATLWHALVRRDGVARRMLPSRAG